MTDRIAKSLSVVWNGRLVGSYDKFESGADQFVYDSDYLRSSDAQPITHSLPRREDAYGSTQIRPFFSGLQLDDKANPATRDHSERRLCKPLSLTRISNLLSQFFCCHTTP